MSSASLASWCLGTLDVSVSAGWFTVNSTPRSICLSGCIGVCRLVVGIWCCMSDTVPTVSTVAVRSVGSRTSACPTLDGEGPVEAGYVTASGSTMPTCAMSSIAARLTTRALTGAKTGTNLWTLWPA